MTKSTDLQDKLTRASEGSRELDAEVHKAFNDVKPGYFWDFDAGELSQVLWMRKAGFSSISINTPDYTTSLDAALALLAEVLPGWDWGRRQGEMYLISAYTEDGISKYRGFDSGAPLLPAPIQLCIAILKATQGDTE